MATEDFTTWTENDPEDDVTVTASRISYDGVPLVSSHYYVDKNYGADHFPGDFSHDLDINVSNMNTDDMVGIYAISAAGGSHYDLAVDDIIIFAGQGGAGFSILIVNGGMSNNDSSLGLSYNTNYYLTISRSGEVYTCVIYSDSARTTTVDTITITESPAKSFSYIGVVVGPGDFGSTADAVYYCENLDIKEAVAAAFMKTNKYWGA